MNALGIDFGTKNIGVAIAVSGIIQPLTMLKNNDQVFVSLQKIIEEYRLERIYIGLSDGKIAELTKKFIEVLKTKISLNVETVEETATTIEAQEYQQNVDAVSAAIILRRCLD